MPGAAEPLRNIGSGSRSLTIRGPRDGTLKSGALSSRLNIAPISLAVLESAKLHGKHGFVWIWIVTQAPERKASATGWAKKQQAIAVRGSLMGRNG